MYVSAPGFRVRKDRKDFPAFTGFPSASSSPSTSSRAQVPPSSGTVLPSSTGEFVALTQQMYGVCPERYVIVTLKAQLPLH